MVWLEIDVDGANGGSRRTFTPEEEEEFSAMSRSPDFYERFAGSIAPSIFGNVGMLTAHACVLRRANGYIRHQEGSPVSINGRIQESAS